jgi:hypothetical protein
MRAYTTDTSSLHFSFIAVAILSIGLLPRD